MTELVLAEMLGYIFFFTSIYNIYIQASILMLFFYTQIHTKGAMGWGLQHVSV